MLTYLETNLLSSPAQTLVNTVNTEGVMGKGIAKQFKEKFPEMFPEYKQMCDAKKIQVGNLHLWRGEEKWILNFPTKTTWRQPSKISYIEEGLKKFVEAYEKLGIISISFPRLGCGNGQLSWDRDVKPLMEKYLSELPINIYIHSIQTNSDFIPEHKELEVHIPSTADKFISDIQRVLYDNRGSFETFEGCLNFHASLKDDCLKIIEDRNGENDIIPREELRSAWSSLQFGILSSDDVNVITARHKNYLLPILSELPYIQKVVVQDSKEKDTKIALLLRSDSGTKSTQGSLL